MEVAEDEVVVDAPPLPAPPSDFLVIIVVSNLRNCCDDMIRSKSVVGLGDLRAAAATAVVVDDVAAAVVIVDLSFILILPPAVDERSAC